MRVGIINKLCYSKGADIMDLYLDIEEKEKTFMEHNPYISLEDDTEITYSDIKEKDGNQYITIYFETPMIGGFKSMDIVYPNGIPEHVKGYTKTEIDKLLYHYNKIGKLVYEYAKEDAGNA